MADPKNNLMKPYNPSGINPALMTIVEYVKAMNKDGKSHPSSAYNVSVSDMNQDYHNGKEVISTGKLVQRVRLRGLEFRIYIGSRENRYGRTDADGEYIRDDEGKITYMTPEEITEKGMEAVARTVYIVDENDNIVGQGSDEWGTTLLMVAKEYRSFGLGTLLGKITRTLYPDRESGGFTHRGIENFRRVHREFVRDAITSGLYTKMVRAGEITAARVKEIIASAKIENRPKKTDDFAKSPIQEWKLFVDTYGGFILYDPKLPTVLEEHEGAVDFSLMERFVYGFVYCREGLGVMRIKDFGGDSEPIRSMMLSLAYTEAKREGIELWVEPSEADIKGFTYGEITNEVGYDAAQVLSGKPFNYIPAAREEIAFRKSFDKYSEFKSRLIEIAEAKYRNT